VRTVSFVVFGDPVPQGSKRAFAVYRGRGAEREFTGKVAVTDNAGSRLAEWRQSIIAAVRERFDGDAPLEGPLSISLQFLLRRPKKPKHPMPATRPDYEKLARAVGDALKAAGVYRDDGQIVTASVRKRFAIREGPGVLITVAEEAS
jgi:Holliday junction resolvase RusA-like endonuclease